MAKSKYAPALFEVITKDEKPSGKLPLPKWWRNKTAPTSSGEAQQSAQPSTPPPQPAVDSSASPASEAVPSPSVAAPQPELSAPAPPPAALQAPVPASPPTTGTRIDADIDEERPPIARVREGRFELSLNATNAAIVGGALLIGLFLAYQMGRGIGRPAAPATAVVKNTDELDTVRNSPATPAVLDVPTPGERRSLRSGTGSSAVLSADTAKPPAKASPPAKPAPPPAPTVAAANRSVQVPPPAPTTPGQRVSGLTYVILETFDRSHRAEAEQIQRWLQEKYGVSTTIEPSGERFQLVSTQGFDYNNSTEKAKFDEFCQFVKGLGKQYKAEFGSKANYMMREPYGRKYIKR